MNCILTQYRIDGARRCFILIQRSASFFGQVSPPSRKDRKDNHITSADRKYLKKRINYVALEKYAKEFGNLLVRQKYRTEENVPLGAHVKNIRIAYNKKKLLAVDVNKLNEMGFIWNVHEYKEKLHISALLKYRELNGHFHVPEVYYVNESDTSWDREHRGLNLGRIAKQLRFPIQPIPERKRKFLESEGFIFSLAEYKLYLFRDALLAYHEIILDKTTITDVYSSIHSLTPTEIKRKIHDVLHGPVSHVGRRFVVPNKAPWPRHLWGLKLGYQLNNVRNNNHFKQHYDKLVEMGVFL